jgi:hypothetical protein
MVALGPIRRDLSAGPWVATDRRCARPFVTTFSTSDPVSEDDAIAYVPDCESLAETLVRVMACGYTMSAVQRDAYHNRSRQRRPASSFSKLMAFT